MLKNISWSDYWIFIGITLVVYYASVSALYYLNEIKQIFSGNSSLRLKLNHSKRFVITNLDNKGNYSNTDNISSQPVNDINSVVSEYMNEIKSLLQQAAHNNLIRQEIIYSLQQLANKYFSIRDSPFKSFITNYIFIECYNYCSIHLDEDELKGMWAN